MDLFQINMANIQVKNLQTGQTGTLPSENFNPAKYQLLNPQDNQHLGPEHQPIGGQEQPARPLGGLIPTIGGVLGGLAGRIIGGGTNMAAAGGSAVGAAAAVPIESGIQTLQGNVQSPQDNLRRMGSEALTSAGSEYGGSIVGDLLGRASKFIGGQLVKAALPESGKLASTEFAKEALGKGEQLSTGIMKRDIVGSSGKLVQIADTAKKFLSEKIDSVVQDLNKAMPVTSDLVSPGIQGGTEKRGFTLLQDAGKEPLNKAQQFIRDVLDQAGQNLAKDGGVGDVSTAKTITTKLNDIWGLQKLRAAGDGWQAVADLKDIGNFVGKGAEANTQSAAEKKVYSEVSDVLNKKLREEIPQLADPFTEYGFYKRLGNAAANKGGKSLLSGGPLAIPTKLVTNPLVNTSLAQLLKQSSRFAAPVVGAGVQTTIGGAKQLLSQ